MARRKNGGTRRTGPGSRRLGFENLEYRVVMSGSNLAAPILAQAASIAASSFDEQPLAAEEQPLAAVADSLISTLPYWRFTELTPAQIPQLSLAQVASIPTVGWFTVLAPEARAAFTQPQVQSLRVDLVRINLLTPQQVSWLTTSQIQSLAYWDFSFLNATQTPWLTPTQISTIPDTGPFASWSAAARAALTAPQVQRLNVSTIRLEFLTSQQVSWLSTAQIQSLPYYDFNYLSAAQSPSLTPSQIATIPDTGQFAAWSTGARAALTISQVQRLNVSTIRLEFLTAQQVSWLSIGQLQTLDYLQFKYLGPTQVPALLPAQIATIPNPGTFTQWSVASRAALTQPQVRALRAGPVRIELLTPVQVSWLTAPQIQTLEYWDFRFLAPSQIPTLTTAQIDGIPSVGAFLGIPAASRAALIASQIQALDVSTMPLDYLTAAQISWLAPFQIHTLGLQQFKFLGPAQIPYLLPSQIATIPDPGTFTQWSEASRAALTQSQIQALRVGPVRIELLSPLQVSWLTAAQIQTLEYWDFRFLAPSQFPILTPAQIAGIPSVGAFLGIPAASRAALIASQIQALDVSTMPLELLTATQISWLAPNQVRTLGIQQFKFLGPAQIPNLLPSQIAAIPDPGTFTQWSEASRAALTQSQIQALRVGPVRIELLTPLQVSWLTVAQIQTLIYWDFRFLAPAQIPSLTSAQVASLPSIGIFGGLSAAARAALTAPQIQAINVAIMPLDMLTTQQIGWLTPAQVQSLDSGQFERLTPAQIKYISTAQMAALPADYYVRNWSDLQLGELTQAQILAMPYRVFMVFSGMREEYLPPSTYVPATQGGHHDLDAPSAEANQFLNLVPIQAATHISVGSGNWSDPAVWHNGVVPGANARVVVAAGTNVRFDGYSNTAIFTLRIDGTLEFATNRDTLLKVDTVVVTTHGALHIGTETAPIADNVTARILIADNGPINTAWDPYLWSRGVVSRGELRIYGKTVTPFTAVTNELVAGATTLTLGSIPVGWQVGDELVIGGTNSYTDDFGADRVRIRAISGVTVTVDPLRYSHQTPAGQGLFIYVANMSRNIQFSAEGSPVALQRPHFAQVHNPDAIIENLGVYGFGRTNKDAPINSSVVINGALKPGTGTNPRARYAIHFHHTGVNPAVAPATIRGSLVVDSPGWAYVNHSSNVVMENNVSFGALGAGFVGEDGNEIGVMRGNLAMNAVGSGEHLLGREDDHDFGHGGHGYWFQGPGIDVTANISIGSREAAFAYLPQSSKVLFDAVNMTDPSLAAGHAAVPVGVVPLKRFDGNIAISSKSGLEIWHHMTLMPAGQTIINRFTSWNNRYAGIDLLYAGNVTVTSPKLLGNEYFSGVGISTNRLTHDVTIVSPYITGFEIGIDVPVRQNTYIMGGYISAVQGLLIEKGYDTVRKANIGGIAFAAPTADQLRGRTYYAVYATAAYDFYSPEFLGRRIDSLFSQDDIKISFRGARPVQLYFVEQDPYYVAFPSAIAAGHVPQQYIDKTNQALRSEFGVSLAGGFPPATAYAIPGVRAYLRTL